MILRITEVRAGKESPKGEGSPLCPGLMKGDQIGDSERTSAVHTVTTWNLDWEEPGRNERPQSQPFYWECKYTERTRSCSKTNRRGSS